MNLKFETIVNIFRKIMQLNAVIILKNTNEYNQKMISKIDRKMDLYPALIEKKAAYVHGSSRIPCCRNRMWSDRKDKRYRKLRRKCCCKNPLRISHRWHHHCNIPNDKL